MNQIAVVTINICENKIYDCETGRKQKNMKAFVTVKQ